MWHWTDTKCFHCCYNHLCARNDWLYYSDVIMSAMASQITSVSMVCSTSKKPSKLSVTGLCEGNSPVTGEFPSQRASNAEKVSIWWRHRVSCGSPPYNTVHLDHWFRFGAIPLPHWGRHKMTDIFQTTFTNSFSCMKTAVFWFRFHWNLFPTAVLTII